MAEEKDKKNEVPASWYGISAGIIIFILIVAILLMWPESKPPALVKEPAAPQVATYPLCADGGEYDFSNLDIKKVGKVEFPISRRDCWIKVTLPSKNCVTHDSSVDVIRAWDDGVTDVEGPNRINQSHTGRIIFVKALQGEGVYKIFARN